MALTGFKAARARRRHARAAANGRLFCSFCGCSQNEIQKLIAGPAVFICDGCVALCNGILHGESGTETEDAWAPWRSLADAELLETLPGVLTHAETVREGLQARVDELRDRGTSWARIGEALSMSRQAAWERFS